MKKIIFIVTLCLMLLNKNTILLSQQKNISNDKNTTNIKIDTNSTELNNNKSKDTIITDREITFDLKKLSLMASASVYGNKKYEASGLVIVTVDIDSCGIITKIEIQESENKKLNFPALEIIRKYAKKYKLQPAIKNGVPVETKDLVVPIIFDMNIFRNK